MRSFEIRRETSWAQAFPGCGMKTSDIHLTVLANTEEQFLEIAFGDPERRSERMCDLAGDRMLGLAERLPFARDLSVEAGVVLTASRRRGAALRAAPRGYLSVLWRGTVLFVEPLASRGSVEFPWREAIGTEAIDPSLPVVLGPSAALTVVSYGLEVLGSGREPAPDILLPSLTIIDTARSPYPPQCLSRMSGIDQPEDLLLLEQGTWQVREGSGGVADPLFFLLTRPERALRPLAVSSHFGRRNLAIKATRSLPFPASALVVDSCRPRVGPRRGLVPFDAEVSVVRSPGEWYAGSSPLRFQFDPWRLLAHTRGGHSRPRPAIDRDPIEGDAYGWAPSLLLDLTAAQLLGGEAG